MTATIEPKARAPVGASVGFVVSALLYMATMASISDLHESDAAGRGRDLPEERVRVASSRTSDLACLIDDSQG